MPWDSPYHRDYAGNDLCGQRAVELQMPLVVNLSFGNTYGAHDGSSLLERFLDNA